MAWLSIQNSFSQTPPPDTTQVNQLNELSAADQWFDFHKSLTYAQKALQLAEQLAYQKGIAVAKYRIAHCYWALGDSELAIHQGLQAAAIAEKHNYRDIAAETFRILAVNYRDQKDLAKAESYISRAEKIAIETKNWDLLSRVYNLAGVIQFTQKRYDRALALYNKSLQIALEHPISQLHLSQVYSNIGEIYGLPQRFNAEKQSYYFEKALSTARETRNRSAEAAILNNIGKVLILKNQYAEATPYLNASLDLALKLNVKRIIKNIYLSFIDLKVREGKSTEAQAYIEKYYDVRDGLLNEQKTRQIVEMETRFETEKKEQTIRLLEQEKQIQTIWTSIWITGSLLLLAAVVIIYRLQRQRARKAKQMLDVQTELNNKLTEADRLKSRFFANISHEFRTPLSLILAPVEDMISSPTALVSQKNDLRLVRRNANRLLELVNQLLDLSKIDAGKMKLQMQNEGLADFLTILTDSFTSLAQSRLIHFNRSIKIDKRDAWFDKDKLEKMVNNILSNAFNFTGSGGSVNISAMLTNDGSDLLIQVTDSGKGIPHEDLPHIFSPFYQSSMIADGQPGTGLGLTLVNELVKLHHGNIDLKSEMNVGTVITISIPVIAERLDFEEVSSGSILKNQPHEMYFDELEADEPAIRNGAHDDCILVVEDNRELRDFIASCFEQNFRVIKAQDGEEGFKLAIENIPDLIISDVMMPNVDGNVFTEKIKKDDRTSHIPVVMLTAKTNAGSRIDGFRHGADDYLAKPFSTEELRVRVTNLISSRKKLVSKYRNQLMAPAKPNHMPSADDKFLSALRTTIEQHLSNPLFGVEMLAEDLCMSRTQLFRKVKALLDISPNELINDIRLQRAAEMIRFKADSITQIGYSVGYNEQSYFAKRFRKKFGVSPSEYANP